MDISAVLLYKVLETKNLEVWSKLKLAFLDSAYSSVYAAIARHYETYSSIPSFEELEITLRDGETKRTIEAIKLADVPDVDIDIVLDALIDAFTQNETVRLLDKFVDNLPVYNTVEIKENLANIVLTLDDKTLTTEGVFNMNDILLFVHEADTLRNRIALGLNNTFDATIGNAARQELILIGGRRGAGKSITGSNIQVNQYEAGNTSVFFTIEMSAREVLERNISILSGVDHQAVKQNKLDQQQLLQVVKTRASMFEESDDLVLDFLKHKDRFKFEENLIRSKKLKEGNQMIIIDDRALTITSIDLHLAKLKAKFGDKLTTVVVDYVNKVHIEGANRFDWQPQIVVSEKLKEMARKYDILMVSPYQIDSTGEARFAKGILDAADIALVLKAHDKETGAISFETTKIRGASEMIFTSGINWETLRISPQSIDPPKEKETIKRAGKKSEKTEEPSEDLPWNT